MDPSMATTTMGLAQSLPSTTQGPLIALACFFLFFFYFFRLNGDTSLPRNWPLMGMLPGLMLQHHRFHDFITDVLRETSCTFMFRGPWFSGMKMLFTCDPANANHIFGTNFSNYPKGEDFLEIFDILGNGILSADGDWWKTQRKMTHVRMTDPGFRRFVAKTTRDKAEKGLVPLFEQLAARPDRSAVDLQDVLLRFTFDTTCILLLGFDTGCLSAGLPTVPFTKAMDDAKEVAIFRHIVPKSWWKLMRWLGIGEEKRMAAAQVTIDRFLADIISKRIEEDGSAATAPAPAPEELLTSFLDNIRPPEIVGDVTAVGSSKKFLRDTAVNLLFAGRDTTGAALTWFFWLVSKNPAVEEKILEELHLLANSTKRSPCQQEEVVEEQDHRHPAAPAVLFDVEELQQGTSVYLHAALCETMRLFPPLPINHKCAVHADVLPSGEKVEPKTMVLFSLYAMGRMEGVWGEDCLEFKPERWISGNGELRHQPSYKFLAFSTGPRACLGKDMAFTQMKVVAAAIIYNFHVQVLEGHVVAPDCSVLLHMKNGLMVTVKKRMT